MPNICDRYNIYSKLRIEEGFNVQSPGNTLLDAHKKEDQDIKSQHC